MSRHIETITTLTALWQLVPVLFGTVIVGKGWPSPRWFLSASLPPGTNAVVSNGVQVVSNGVDVVST